MHHEVVAPVAGVIDELAVGDGDTVTIGQEFARIADGCTRRAGADLVHRPLLRRLSGWSVDDLREVIERHGVGLDEQRPQAVERRRVERDDERPGRTSPISSTTARSSSTARS